MRSHGRQTDPHASSIIHHPLHTFIADSAYKPKVTLLTLLHSSLSLIYQSLVHTYDATQPYSHTAAPCLATPHRVAGSAQHTTSHRSIVRVYTLDRPSSNRHRPRQAAQWLSARWLQPHAPPRRVARRRWTWKSIALYPSRVRFPPDAVLPRPPPAARRWQP